MQQLIPPCEPQRPDISFPTELLPEVLKRTVQNVVEAFRVPENIVGVQVLGLLSGCLGKVYSLQFNGNRVRSNLFLLIVEGSGVGKSRPMDYLRKVITEIETAREYSLATQKSLWKREKRGSMNNTANWGTQCHDHLRIYRKRQCKKEPTCYSKFILWSGGLPAMVILPLKTLPRRL